MKEKIYEKLINKASFILEKDDFSLEEVQILSTVYMLIDNKEQYEKREKEKEEMDRRLKEQVFNMLGGGI